MALIVLVNTYKQSEPGFGGNQTNFVG